MRGPLLLRVLLLVALLTVFPTPHESRLYEWPAEHNPAQAQQTTQHEESLPDGVEPGLCAAYCGLLLLPLVMLVATPQPVTPL